MGEWLLERGFRILGQRERVLRVEVDLLARSKEGVLILIEVKSLRHGEWLEQRLSWRQRARLRRVAQALAEGVPWKGEVGAREVELWLVAVGATKASVQVYPDLG